MPSRRPLVSLEPSWLASSPARLGMGIRFRCPVHPFDCFHSIWFLNPIDDGEPVTLVPELIIRTRERSSFEDICLYGPVHHGDLVLVVYDGLITVVDLN